MANNHKQYIISSQQIRLIRNYTDVSSETFGNAYSSAIKAGYSKGYARNVTSRYLQKWKLPELVKLAEDWAPSLLGEIPKEIKERLLGFNGTGKERILDSPLENHPTF